MSREELSQIAKFVLTRCYKIKNKEEKIMSKDSQTTLYDKFVKKMFDKHCPANKIVQDEAGNHYTYFPPLPWWLSLLIKVQIWLT